MDHAPELFPQTSIVSAPDRPKDCAEDGLPRPQLIVRIGGLGNRHFGRDNGIDEDPAALHQAAQTACNQVFDAVEKILSDILQDDRGRIFPHPDAFAPGWNGRMARILGGLFGTSDRWHHSARAGTSAAVFDRTKPPRITVLTGDASGGDRILRDLAVERQARQVRQPRHLEYGSQWIVTKDPAEVTDGLGVGSMPAELPEPAITLDARQRPVSPPQPRAEAAARAVIARQRAFACRAQSEALRHHSDVLLAIWDPDTEGKAGGTSERVNLALDEGIPVIAIRLVADGEVGRAAIDVLESVEDLNRLLATSAGRPSGVARPWKEALAKVLGGILKFPERPSGPSKTIPGAAEEADTEQGGVTTTAHEDAPRLAYEPRSVFAAFREARPLRRIGMAHFWQGFESLVKSRAGLDRPGEPQTCLGGMIERWMHVFETPEEIAFPGKGTSKGDYTAHYQQVRERAAGKGMSGVYGDAHRGGIIASYLLAAVAVLLAVLGAIFHFYKLHVGLVIVTAAVEVVVIVAMFTLSICSRHEGWNEAYTDTRVLAEALRMMEYLGPLGLHTPLPRLPRYLQGDQATPAPQAMWCVWYFRALTRMAPLRLADPRLGSLTAAHRVMIDGWIRDQQKYHRRNRIKQKKLHHDIERFTTVLFVIVFGFALEHLVEAVCGLHGIPLTVPLLVCVGGPALIAAMHGFSSQIEVERLRQRSTSMEKLLQERIATLESLDLSDPANASAVWGLSREALNVAALMIDETASWSMLYKPGIRTG